jgi:hypothetical protein
MSEISDRDVARVLEALRANIAQLPVFELHFGGARLNGIPPSLVREKVLAMIDGQIRRAREPQGRIGEV